MLFIRPTNLATRFDLSNKTVKAETLEKATAPTEEYVISDQSAYIELLQIMLDTKGHDAHFRNKNTKLTIVLTCWDEEKNSEAPVTKLRRHLPLFLSFVQANWEDAKINIVGLSALGFSLKIPENKLKYQEYGAESFGYIIDADGKEIEDITQLISQAL